MKVARNWKRAYIASVIPSSTASYHNAIEPTSTLFPIAWNWRILSLRADVQLEHQCTWMTPRSCLELCYPSSPLFGVTYISRLFRVLSEHSDLRYGTNLWHAASLIEDQPGISRRILGPRSITTSPLLGPRRCMYVSRQYSMQMIYIQLRVWLSPIM